MMMMKNNILNVLHLFVSDGDYEAVERGEKTVLFRPANSYWRAALVGHRYGEIWLHRANQREALRRRWQLIARECVIGRGDVYCIGVSRAAGCAECGEEMPGEAFPGERGESLCVDCYHDITFWCPVCGASEYLSERDRVGAVFAVTNSEEAGVERGFYKIKYHPWRWSDGVIASAVERISAVSSALQCDSSICFVCSACAAHIRSCQ